MVTFRTSIMPYDVLFKRLFYSHGFRCRPVSEQKLNAVRVSMHVFNTPAECDALAETAADILRRA
jgi:selenocysteine lyase/cysteine desulfurase